MSKLEAEAGIERARSRGLKKTNPGGGGTRVNVSAPRSSASRYYRGGMGKRDCSHCCQSSQTSTRPRGESPAQRAGLVRLFTKDECACRVGKLLLPKVSTRIAASDREAIFADDFEEVIASHPALFGALGLPSERLDWLGEIAGIEIDLDDAKRQRSGVERMFAETAISKGGFEEFKCSGLLGLRAGDGGSSSLS